MTEQLRVLIPPSLVEPVMREFGWTEEQVREKFIVTSRPKVEPADPAVAANMKALHRQALDKIRRR